MSEKRSSGRAKKVDYAALQEIKIEEVDCDDDFDDTTEKVVIVPSSPPKKKRKTTQQSAKDSEIVTDGKCGLCSGCRRKPCTECSFCNSGDFGNCIDLYCMNQKEGRSQREAAREAYLMSLGKARLHEEKESENDVLVDKPKSDLSVKQQIDLIMEEIGAAQKNRSKHGIKQPNSISSPPDSKTKVQKSPNKAKSTTGGDKKDPVKTRVTGTGSYGVYGGSPNAAKTRRCGECEGCMRDDCGQCAPCADKPRFGGPGTKKKACVQRFCRTRKLEEDHAAANFPLNSPDALKTPRPVSKLGKKATKVEKVEIISADTVTEPIEQTHELFQDESVTNIDDNIADEFMNDDDGGIEDAILQD